MNCSAGVVGEQKLIRPQRAHVTRLVQRLPAEAVQLSYARNSMSNRTGDPPVQRYPSDAPAPADRFPAQRSIRNACLTAGIALLLMSVAAIFGNVMVVNGLVTEGDAARTAADVIASARLLRLGIASLMGVIALDVVVAWALYRVFSPVNASLSMLAAMMRLVYSAVFMVAIGQLLGVIRLLSDDSNRAVLGADQVQIHALQGMSAFNDIWYVGQFLFGLHLLLIGYLAYRSGYVPRAVGALLVIAGLGYGTDSFGAVLSQKPWTDISSFTFLGEFLLALWLVIRARPIGTRAAAFAGCPGSGPWSPCRPGHSDACRRYPLTARLRCQ